MRLHHMAIVASSFALAACGGTTTPTPAPTPSSPVLGATQTSVTVAENSTGTLTAITIADEDIRLFGLTLEGADSDDFNITADGNLSFKNPPDFELPTDQDGDNVYNVVVVATDTFGGRSTIAVTVTVTNITDFVALRYLDPIFTDLTTLGELSIPSSSGSGTFSVTMIAPKLDSVTDRPLVLVSSGDFFGTPAVSPITTAQQFAMRGYVVGIITAGGPASVLGNQNELAAETARATRDVFAAANYFLASASTGNRFGLDGKTILVAGEGTGALVASMAATVDAGDRFTNPAIAGIFANQDASVFAPIRGAMSLSGGHFDMGLVDSDSAPIFAAHRASDTRLGCNSGGFAGSCSLVRGLQSQGISAQLHVLDGSSRSFTQSEIDAVYQGAAGLFFTSVIQQRNN